MQYEGKVIFKAPKDQLFELLIDAESLAGCIPGIQSFEVLEPEKSFKVATQSKFGLLEPEMIMKVSFTLIDRPDCARLRFRGRGASSHVGASSYIWLNEITSQETEMQWSFTFSVFGQLATIGQRLIEQAFESMHQEFIANVEGLVAQRFGGS